MTLRRASSARIEKSGFWIFARYEFFFTATQAFEVDANMHGRLLAEREQHGVALVGRDRDRVLWWAESGFYWSDPELGHEEVELLLWNRQRRQESQLERLRKIRVRADDLEHSRRERIPDEVRTLVWARDDGVCVRCGAEEDLQFDHVIPVARGGGTNVENIQVLCGDCNRQKSSSIA
jgi:5-methylcytosine-specific restriction endonuclease McrA